MPDDDVDVAGPDPPPLVGPLAVAEPRVDERDAGVEVGPQPVDERQGEGDLGDEHERRPTGLERRRDGLDVDRRLAAAGHAVEQQRPRVAGVRWPRRSRSTAVGLRRRQVRRRRPAAAQTRRPRRQRPARSLADLGLDQAAADEAGDGRASPCARRELGAGRPSARPRCRQLGERRDLARPERAAGRAAAAGERRAAAAALRCQPDPALVARARPTPRAASSRA